MKDFIKLLLLIIAAVIVLYFFPVPLNHLLFLFLLPAVWFSKKDYFWLAFFFIISDIPGGLFSGGARIDLYGLPMFSLGPGIAFNITELFFIVILIKALTKSKKEGLLYKNHFKNEFLLVIVLIIFLILITFFMGTSFAGLSNLFKTLLRLSLVYSFFKLINTKEKLFNFLKIIFPFVFIALALQIYALTNKQQLIALVKPGVILAHGVLEPYSGWVRPIEMVSTLFIGFTGSLFLLTKSKHNFNHYYLIIVNLISFIGIYITGTRSWVVAFIIGYIVYLILSIASVRVLFSNIMGLLRFAFIALIFLALVLNYIPVIADQITEAGSRIATAELFLEGDVTAGGTAKRYDQRAPRVIEGFRSSSILLGAGFSDHFYEYADGHVGYHNILLNSGIIGSAIFLFIILKMLFLPFRLSITYKEQIEPWARFAVIPLIVLLVVNIGTQTIGLTLSLSRVFLMVFAITLINISVQKNAFLVEKKIN